MGAAATFLCGASDAVGATMRSTVVMLTTPDHLRGRVSANPPRLPYVCRCVWHKRGCCHPSLPVCIGLSARHYACGVVEFDVCVTGGAIGGAGTLGPLPCSQRGE